MCTYNVRVGSQVMVHVYGCKDNFVQSFPSLHHYMDSDD